MFLLFSASTSLACSLAGPSTLTIQTDPTDQTAPTAPVWVATDIRRGVGPQGGMSTSCDDLGFVTITVARPDDDPDGEEAVGYRLALVEGSLPDDLTLPEEAWLGPELILSWIDGATDDQEPLVFTLSLTPTDAAGNEGEPLVVEISDPGSTANPLGCDVLGGGAGGAWMLGAVALLLRRHPTNGNGV
ncbi:MAG: hypothetical protein KC621_03375 [Myxococcales bacterium]|nr:hypothetical protein [Myxococcales bacterium]